MNGHPARATAAPVGFSRALLGGPTDRQTILLTAARTVADLVGDGAAVGLGPPDRAPSSWAAFHPRTVERQLLEEAMRAGFQPPIGGPGHRPTPEAAATLHPLDVRAIFVIPLDGDEGRVGFIAALRTNSDRPYLHEEISVVKEVAAQLVLALSTSAARERQRGAEERYRRVAEASTEGLWEVDADGRVTFANDRIAEMLGRSPDQIVGEPAESFLDEAGRLAAGRRRRDRHRGIGEQYDDRLVRADGSTVGVRVTAAPLHDGAGRPAGSLWLMTDVTDRLRAIELERQLEQMRRLDSLGQLAGGIAHDFNNLLVVMGGFAQVIAGRLPSESDLGPFAQQIIKAAAKGEALTRQLLTFGRGGLDRGEIVDVGDVIAALEPLLRRTLGERVELVVTRSAEEEPPPVRIDRGKLEQVIINLATNARDAMPGGGRLTIESAYAALQTSHLGAGGPIAEVPCARIAVSDTGAGMDQETQRRAFEPFFTTKERGKGTGLGLATVYGIVRATGGYVGLYSERTLGTTVKVFLRAVEADVPMAAEPILPATDPGTAHILVVEDQDEVAQLIPLLLDGAPGLHVTVLTEPLHALSYAREGHRIDLLLTDVIMPEMTGPELATALREQRPELPVLYMSGYTAGVLDEHGSLTYRADLIEKPFTRAGLLEGVAGTLRRGRQPGSHE